MNITPTQNFELHFLIRWFILKLAFNFIIFVFDHNELLSFTQLNEHTLRYEQLNS